jgi:hypothetical protein
MASAGKETSLTTHSRSIEHTIHTNIITWTGDTNGLGIVHMYDLKTGKDGDSLSNITVGVKIFIYFSMC